MISKDQLELLTQKIPKPRLVITLVVVIFLVLFALVLFRVDKKWRPGAKPPEATAIVTITSGGFVPSTLSVKAGQTVKWINDDDSPHRVASNPHPTHTGLRGFDSKDNLEKGGTFIFTFEKNATFGYHDHLNPQKIQGVINVQ